MLRKAELTEFGKEYMAKWKAKMKGSRYAMPKYRTAGMKDVVLTILGPGLDMYLYPDVHDKILDDSELCEGGYLKPCGHYSYDSYVITDQDITYYSAFMDCYDKYLCTDGVIRYRPTKEANAKFNALWEQKEKDWWEGINSAFEAMGMFYNEEEGLWINPETGEVGCY